MPVVGENIINKKYDAKNNPKLYSTTKHCRYFFLGSHINALTSRVRAIIAVLRNYINVCQIISFQLLCNELGRNIPMQTIIDLIHGLRKVYSSLRR